MSQLFRLDASLSGDASVSRSIADSFERVWRQEHPDGVVLRRDLAADPVPPIDVAAISAGFVPAERRSPEQTAAVALTAKLVDELVSSDAYLLSVPLYNWTTPTNLQAWIDRLFNSDQMKADGPEPIAGRPVVVVRSRGGGYGPGTPREGWDLSGPYLRQILADVWKLDATFITAELTLAGRVEAMAHLTEVADKSLASAHRDAEDQARRVAELVSADRSALSIDAATESAAV